MDIDSKYVHKPGELSVSFQGANAAGFNIFTPAKSGQIGELILNWFEGWERTMAIVDRLFLKASQMNKSISPTGNPGESNDPVLAWLQSRGLQFNPFSFAILDAAKDNRLHGYMLEHQAFGDAWGDWSALVFAPPGGGKTALRARLYQECFIGQFTNRPFPIPYTPPFNQWRSVHPTLGDHLAAIAQSGAYALLLSLIYRPHWFSELEDADKIYVRQVFDENLAANLSVLLEPVLQEEDISDLPLYLPPAFIPPHAPDFAHRSALCQELLATSGIATPGKAPEKRLEKLIDIILGVFHFNSIYLLLDGVDASPETTTSIQAAVSAIAPLFSISSNWLEKKVFLKSFLPIQLQPVLLERYSEFFNQCHLVTLEWTPELLAELIRLRTAYASGGLYPGLSPLVDYKVREPELWIAQKVTPLPREALLLVDRLLRQHCLHQSPQPRIARAEIEAAIARYDHEKSIESTPVER
jgi:hypothetical protein